MRVFAIVLVCLAAVALVSAQDRRKQFANAVCAGNEACASCMVTLSDSAKKASLRCVNEFGNCPGGVGQCFEKGLACHRDIPEISACLAK